MHEPAELQRGIELHHQVWLHEFSDGPTASRPGTHASDRGAVLSLRPGQRGGSGVLAAIGKVQVPKGLEPGVCSAAPAPARRFRSAPYPASFHNLDRLRPLPPEPYSDLAGSRSNFTGKDSPSLQPLAS